MIVDFIIDPEELKKVEILQPIVIKFIDISKIDFLGETGKRMALAGFKFIVTEKFAEPLIKNKYAIRV